MKRNFFTTIMPRLLTRKVEFQVPLSRLVYYTDCIGCPWNQVQLMIPYHRFPLKFSLGHLLEEFKTSLKGDLIVLLQYQRSGFDIEMREIKVDETGGCSFTEVTARIEKFVQEVKSMVGNESLTLEKAHTLLQEKGFPFDDTKINRILSEIIDPLPLLRVIDRVPLPISMLNYHSNRIAFLYKNTQLEVGEDRLPFKAHPVLEEIKEFLKGEIAFHIEISPIRKWEEHLGKGSLQVGQVILGVRRVEMKPETVDSLVQMRSQWEDIIKELKSWAEKGTLNLEKARTLWHAHGFPYDDNQIRQMLAEIILQLPPKQKIKMHLLPLSEVDYCQEGVRFWYNKVQLEAKASQLPFEIGPILEKIKTSLTGRFAFHIEISYFYKWDLSKRDFQAGEVIQGVDRVEVYHQTLEDFKKLRCQRVFAAVKQLIANQSISLEKVEAILKDWGLALGHQEMAKQIAATIPSWTVEKDYQVLLKDITYQNDEILVPIEEEKLRISATDLPFTTSPILENIKEIFDGYISIHGYHPFQLVWDEVKQRLAIEKKRAIKIRIYIDEKTLQRLEKIRKLYIQLCEKMDPFTAKKVLRPLTPVSTVPTSYLESKPYDPECIRILESIADTIYMTDRDLWFRIKNRLVWERAEFGAATYIFEWPVEELEFFIGRIWISELQDIRRDPESRYVNRVIHTPEDVSQWEWNLKKRLRD